MKIIFSLLFITFGFTPAQAGELAVGGENITSRCTAFPAGFNLKTLAFNYQEVLGNTRIEISFPSLKTMPCSWFENRGGGKTIVHDRKYGFTGIPVVAKNESGEIRARGMVTGSYMVYFNEKKTPNGITMDRPEFILQIEWNGDEESSWSFRAPGVGYRSVDGVRNYFDLARSTVVGVVTPLTDGRGGTRVRLDERATNFQVTLH